jgi:hypothetical protein
MASVQFGVLWLAPAADLASGRPFRLHEMQPAPEVPGQFRRYANGRVRLVRQAGRLHGQSFVLRHLDLESVRLVESWTGSLLLVRDPQGRKFYGSFLNPQIAPRPVGTSDMTLTFTEVSFSEAV